MERMAPIFVHRTVIRLFTIPHSCRLLLSALFACAALGGTAWAQDRQTETVPEINAFIRLSDRFRLFTAASVTSTLTEANTDGELGAYLDVLTLRPILQGRLFDTDWARNRYLWGRIGYAVGGIHEGLHLDDGFSEQRFVAEVSARYPISPGFWAVTRARVDLRTLDGERSNRYRLRFGVEKEYTVFGKAVVPYANAEFFYDTRFDHWNRQVYQAGVEVELTQRFRLEPYYAFQIDTGTEPTYVDRWGLVLKYYR
jgi:hypothetical protein